MQPSVAPAAMKKKAGQRSGFLVPVFWDPRNQRPELWNLSDTRIRAGESIRVFPLSNWTELDIWQYIMFENNQRRSVHSIFEIYVDTPLEECGRLDPKGLYAKTCIESIKNFTGFEAPYEHPENSEIHLKTVGETPEQSSERVVMRLKELGIINRFSN